MSTSGEFKTSNGFIVYNISVDTNSQNIENNTSNVTVKVQFWRTNNWAGSTYGSGKLSCRIDSKEFSADITPDKKITKNSKITLFEKTLDIPHNNDGTKTLNVSAKINLSSVLSSGENNFKCTLKAIPRAATFINADNFTDTENPKIYFHNPGKFKLMFKIEAGDNDYLIVRDNLKNPGNPYTFKLTEAERNLLRAQTPNSNDLKVRFTVGTYMPNKQSAGNWSFGDRKMTITNAEPSFPNSNVSFEDTDQNIVAITGSNQTIVRNQSSLAITIPTATAKKNATIARYEVKIGKQKKTSATAGKVNIGKIESFGNQTLTIAAIDSRGNTTTIKKTIPVINWENPTFTTLEVHRVNNYETLTHLFASADISSILLKKSDGQIEERNAVKTSQYRIRKSGTNTWGDWVNFQNNADPATTISMDNNFAWDIQVRIADKFGRSEQILSVPKGTPLMFFDTKKYSVGINCFPSRANSFEIGGKTIADLVYPIGSIYMSVNAANPENLFGGEWERLKDRFLLGVGDTYKTVENTGGSDSHQHMYRIGWHPYYGALVGSDADAIQIFDYQGAVGDGGTWKSGSKDLEMTSTNRINNGISSTAVEHASTNYSVAGNTSAASGLPPYLTVFMWKRTG